MHCCLLGDSNTTQPEYLYHQISRVLDDASAAPGALEDDDDTSRARTGGTSTSTTRYCAPRLPVKVTKCGGQYPYDGAFVTGDVTMTSGPPLSVAALPWRRQDDDDDCYRWGRNNACLFYFLDIMQDGTSYIIIRLV